MYEIQNEPRYEIQNELKYQIQNRLKWTVQIPVTIWSDLALSPDGQPELAELREINLSIPILVRLVYSYSLSISLFASFTQKAFLCSQLLGWLMLEDRNFHLLNFTWAVIINQSRQWWWQVFSKWKYWRQMKTWRIKPTASPSDIVPPTWGNNHIHQLNRLVLMVSPIFEKSDVKPSWLGIAALSLWRDHLYPRQIAWKPEEWKLSKIGKINVIKKQQKSFVSLWKVNI